MRNEQGTRLTLLCLLLITIPVLCAEGDGSSSTIPPVDFARDIRPLFEQRCTSCHGPDKQKSGFRLDVRRSALKGGDLGQAIMSGKGEESPLVRYIAGLEEGLLMPPEGDPLTSEEISLVRRWIDEGATWPDALSGEELLPAQIWWSLRPLATVAIPFGAPATIDRQRSPIDSFITAKLVDKGLESSEPASRQILIRRVTFDLHGLPPTPEDVQEFVGDARSDAYERLVDRLLASPRRGERAARHWMDIVHFAETHGHDQDRIRENAWPYRDYLIEAFNADRPFQRFIKEQLAADSFFPEDPSLVKALGFIAAGPWDESSLKDIRDDTLDRQIAHYIDRDDMVATTMSTFTSMTVHCARCHDHKFEPISQKDYYSLQAVFAGVERANRAYDPDPLVNHRRQELKQDLANISRRDPTLLAKLHEPAFQEKLAAWEEKISHETVEWHALTPTSWSSSDGSTLKLEVDQSICASGMIPEKDTYTVMVRGDIPNITAVRLEVLTDSSLPQSGPGRNANGNLHLSEVRVESSSSSEGDAVWTPVPIVRAVADFNQADWTIQQAIDGNESTAWGIFPEVSKPHEAIFRFKEPVSASESKVLKIGLAQLHGRGHLIGRFRISVTGDPEPERLVKLPKNVALLLQTPVDQRTREQVEEVALYFLRENLERELASLPQQQMVYAGTSDFVPIGSFKPSPEPRAVHVLIRGEITKPAALVEPGALASVTGPTFQLSNPNDESARRAALADWISNPKNPLTWRSIVNRIWQNHFGRGIVDTPSDFGRMGSLPINPELLDWLASEFLESGGSIRELDRMIVTSATYQQSSASSPSQDLIDGDNRFLWRMNRTRLDAESIRDAVLQDSERLDLTMGGPSDRQFAMKPGIHVTPDVNYGEFNWSSPGSSRRSVYRFLFRSLPDPFIDCLDGADASQLTATRNVSVTPLQALVMLNDEFMLMHSEALAQRIETASSERATRIRFACQWTLGREPAGEEMREFTAFVESNGLPAFCRALFNSNEFVFVD